MVHFFASPASCKLQGEWWIRAHDKGRRGMAHDERVPQPADATPWCPPLPQIHKASSARGCWLAHVHLLTFCVMRHCVLQMK